MKRILFTLFILVSCTTTLTAQQEKDSINTEVINVVTSYTPAISDAFKAKDNPLIKENTEKSKNIRYQIHSSPIRSTFRPNIGGYRSAKTAGKKRLYPNYIKAGYGNYGTPLLEAFLYKRKKEHEIDFFLYNKASNGGIDKVLLNDAYLNTQLELGYKNTQRSYNWETNITYHRDAYNWYGLPSDITFDENTLNSISEKQVYNTIGINGVLNLNKGKLKSAAISILNFSDKFESKEMQIGLYPRFELPIDKYKIVTDVGLEVLNGEFKKEYETATKINYGYLTFGTHAYFPIQNDNFFFSIGAKIKYNADLENDSNSKFKFYPDVKVDYVIVDELLNIYAGLNGDLKQNTYQSLVSKNPYISPNNILLPTDNSFTVFGGLKGKLSANIDYNASASFSNEDNKALFKKNKSLTDGTTAVTNGYEAGNSFGIVYDNIKIFDLYGEINTILTNTISAGATMNIKSYSLTKEAEAWNLPSFTASAYGKYTFEKWTGKAELFFVGKRKDYDLDADKLLFLDAYGDLNLNVAYEFSSKWSAFIDANNVLNKNYERFANFEVQGFQILGGFTYRF